MSESNFNILLSNPLLDCDILKIHEKNTIKIFSQNIQRSKPMNALLEDFRSSHALLLQEINVHTDSDAEEFANFLDTKLDMKLILPCVPSKCGIGIKRSTCFTVHQSNTISASLSPAFRPLVCDTSLFLKDTSELILLVCLYCPLGQFALQQALFVELQLVLKRYKFLYHASDVSANAPLLMILGGDFNNVLNPNIDAQNKRRLSTPEADAVLMLKEILQEHSLSDCFRLLNPQLPWATNNVRSLNLSKRRLDRFYLTSSLRKRLSSFEQRPPNIRSSHDVIKITVVINPRSALKVGKTRFRFPDFLLRVPSIVQSLSRLFEYSWDLPALRIKAYAVKSLRLLRILQRIDPSNYNVILGKRVLDEYQQTLVDYNRSSHHSGNIISSLRRNPSAEAETSTEGMLHICSSFYRELYRAPPETPAQRDIALFTETLPIIDRESAGRLDIPFDLEELKAALDGTSKASAPGYDGITYALLDATWTVAGPLLVETANNLMLGLPLPTSMKHNLITLIPKRGKEDSDLINDLRPISLMSCPLKIICSAINTRLLSIADQVIDKRQKGFIPGRHMDENIAQFRHLTEVLSTQNDAKRAKASHRYRDALGTSPLLPDAAVVLLDLEKAFDRISQPFLEGALTHIGLGERLRQAISTITWTQSAMLLINNMLGVPFPQEVGTRQGNPLSPLLFTIGIESLLRRIDLKLVGIAVECSTIAPTIVKYSAFADDIAVFVELPQDYRALNRLLKEFAAASNSRINTDKSIVYTTARGALPLRDPILGFPVKLWQNGDITYLGFNSKGIDWPKEIRNIHTAYHMNLVHHLSIQQQVDSINQFYFSKLVFRDLHTPMTDGQLNQLNNTVNKNIRGVSLKKLQARKEHGGFGLLDIPLQLRGRRAMMIYNLLTNETDAFYIMFRDRLQKVTNRIFGRPQGDSVAWFMVLIGQSVLHKQPQEIRKRLHQSSMLRSTDKAYLEAWFQLTRPGDRVVTQYFISHNNRYPLVAKRAPAGVLPAVLDIAGAAVSPASFRQLSKKQREHATFVAPSAWAALGITREKWLRYWKYLKKLHRFHPKVADALHRFCLGSQTYALRSLTECPMCQETLSAYQFEHCYQWCIVARKSWTHFDLPGHSPSLFQLIANYTATWTLTSKMDKYIRFMDTVRRARLPLADHNGLFDSRCFDRMVALFITTF